MGNPFLKMSGFFAFCGVGALVLLIPISYLQSSQSNGFVFALVFGVLAVGCFLLPNIYLFKRGYYQLTSFVAEQLLTIGYTLISIAITLAAGYRLISEMVLIVNVAACIFAAIVFAIFGFDYYSHHQDELAGEESFFLASDSPDAEKS